MRGTGEANGRSIASGQSRLQDALAGGAVCGCCEPRKRLGPIAHLTDPAAAAVR